MFKFSDEMGTSLRRRGRVESSCMVRPDQLSWTHQPLLFSTTRDWLFAEPNGDVNVADGVLLYCPGTFINCSAGAASPNLLLTCSSQELLSGDQPVNLNECGCIKNPKDREQKVDGSCGPDDAGQLAEVGFQIDTSFKPVFTICHDRRTENTFYTRHQIRGATLINKQVGHDDPAFKKGKLFFKGFSVSKAYTQANQRELFTRIIDAAAVEEVFSSNYMARGHLSPDADFIFKDWQESTYYYGNTAPQWQSINNGNWKRLEFAVRELAASTGALYEIYTGTFGVMRLNGEEVWLAQKNKRSYIPVPEFFFKIITDVEGKRSMAVFCTNNPLLPRVTRSKILCNDICDETGWGKHFEQRREVENGILFCCSPSELSEILPWAGPRGLHTHTNLLI